MRESPMTPHESSNTFVLRENGEWLRYVLWGSALGMGFLAVSTINAPVRDLGKIIGGIMGILLFTFSGFVMQTRRVAFDPIRREVVIANRGFKHTTCERLSFNEIKKILVVTTFDMIENLRGTDVMRERWLIALALEERSVPITKNLYVTKEQALRDAEKIQRLLNVDISDIAEDSIAHLAQTGKKVEAVTQGSRRLGMTTTQAKDFVDEHSSPTSRSRPTR